MDLTDLSSMYELLPRVPDLRPPLPAKERLRLPDMRHLRVVHRVRQLMHRRHGEEPLLPEYQAHHLRVRRGAGGDGGEILLCRYRRLQEDRTERDDGGEAVDGGRGDKGRVHGPAVPGPRFGPRVRCEGRVHGGESEVEHGGHAHEQLVEMVVVLLGEGRVGPRYELPAGEVGDVVPAAEYDRMPEDLQVEGFGEVSRTDAERRAKGSIFDIGDVSEAGRLEDRVDRAEVAEVGVGQVEGAGRDELAFVDITDHRGL